MAQVLHGSARTTEPVRHAIHSLGAVDIWLALDRRLRGRARTAL